MQLLSRHLDTCLYAQGCMGTCLDVQTCIQILSEWPGICLDIHLDIWTHVLTFSRHPDNAQTLCEYPDICWTLGGCSDVTSDTHVDIWMCPDTHQTFNTLWMSKHIPTTNLDMHPNTQQVSGHPSRCLKFGRHPYTTLDISMHVQTLERFPHNCPDVCTLCTYLNTYRHCGDIKRNTLRHWSNVWMYLNICAEILTPVWISRHTSGQPDTHPDTCYICRHLSGCIWTPLWALSRDLDACMVIQRHICMSGYQSWCPYTHAETVIDILMHLDTSLDIHTPNKTLSYVQTLIQAITRCLETHPNVL